MRPVAIAMTLTCAALLAACGDDGNSGPGVEDFYPVLPAEGGEVGAQAGEIEAVGQLVSGPALATRPLTTIEQLLQRIYK